jgi:hypothetical protein
MLLLCIQSDKMKSIVFRLIALTGTAKETISAVGVGYSGIARRLEKTISAWCFAIAFFNGCIRLPVG